MILIIDGQGGRMGKMLVEQLVLRCPNEEIVAVGTNTVATGAMLKAGAAHGATGENPVVVLSKKAKLIIGPIGILIPDALYGEVTPKMAAAIGESGAEKILIPVNRCGISVVGVKNLPLGDAIAGAVELAVNALETEKK